MRRRTFAPPNFSFSRRFPARHLGPHDGQKRIFDFQWSHYNGAHVVARPQNMTPEQLREQFIRSGASFFSMQKTRHAAALEPATWKDGAQVVGKPLQRQGVRADEAVVTGIGLFSPIGNDAATVTEALRTGRHGIAPVSRFDTSIFARTCLAKSKISTPPTGSRSRDCKEYEDLYLRLRHRRRAPGAWRRGIAIGRNGAIRRDIAMVLGTCNGGLCLRRGGIRLETRAQFARRSTRR
jgi:hypothetical protein